MENQNFQSESKLTFLEATGVILGHGVGAGILSVPFMASLNNWWDVVWILALAFIASLLLHLLIAELSYNNGGAMLVKCLEPLLKKEKAKKIVTIIAAICFGFSVLANCTAYCVGSAQALLYFFPEFDLHLTAIIFYVFAAIVVFFGMKVVGVCEKYCTLAMTVIMIILVLSLSWNETGTFIKVDDPSVSKMLALFGMVTFSLSAVMSVPQAVKGLNGNVKKIRGAIILGQSVNILIVALLTIVTVLLAGDSLDSNGAIINISNKVGGWLGIVGTLFTLFALVTSFWANTLDLRDVVAEQFHLNLKLSWVIASAPALILTLITTKKFTALTATAGVVQVLTCFGIIAAYHYSRKQTGKSDIVGKFGSTFFQILAVVLALLATIGSLIGMFM